MTVHVMKAPKGTGERDLFAEVAERAGQMRQHRDALVSAAMSARERAIAAIDAAQVQMNKAREAKLEAESQLRSLLEKGEVFIVGDSAVEIADHGGLHVRRARVLGIV